MSKFMDDIAIPLGSFLALIIFLIFASHAHSADFSVPFKPLKPVPALLEVTWQVENAIDYQQTMRICHDPVHYSEVGTMSPFTGPHPSAKEVALFTVAFGLAHFAVSQFLQDRDMDKTLLVWEATSVGWKTWNMNRNHNAGLGY